MVSGGTCIVELTAFELGYLTAALSTESDETAKAIYDKLLKASMAIYNRQVKN